jgi:hypothetical protein
MGDTIDGLDAFLNSGDNSQKTNNETSNKDTSSINVENEFAELLNSFITQDTGGEETKQDEGLDSFISAASFPESNSTSESNPDSIDSLLTAVKVETISVESNNNDTPVKTLKSEEQDLARSISNFKDAIYTMADKKNLKLPETDYNEEMLYPNYKPSVGKKIATYLLACWDIVYRYDPENMKKLAKDANDEEYLTFAEGLNDTDLQLAIISYVEILINVETCEFLYKQRFETVQKNRIKKELYEEYIELQERKAQFIKKLKEKHFPIDVDRLINNYFRAAQNDATGAFEALTKNPAMFARIDFNQIKPKFFGLIKVSPEDGIKANQKIGEYIKKLKV